MVTDTHCPDAAGIGWAEGATTVAKQVTRRFIPGEGVSDLACGLLVCRIGSHSNRDESPAGVTQNHQAIEQLARDRPHHEQIQQSDGALTPQEMRKATHSFDSKALGDLLALFSDLLRGAEQKAPTLWNDRIGPWLKKYWPTTKEKQSGRNSLLAAELAINGKEAFPLIVE